jgi:FAD-dependent urate hydroxylase
MRIAVVGAGIGGLTAAILLQDQGIDVSVYEQAPALRPLGTGLSIMANAVLALKRLGREDLVRQVGQPIGRCEMRHAQCGKLITEFPIREVSAELGVESYCVHRGHFLLHLREQLKAGSLHLNSKVVHVENLEDGRAKIKTEAGEIQEFDAVIGADGYNSPSRESLGKMTPPRPTKFLAWLAVVECKPEWGIEPGDVFHYWGKGTRVGLVDIGHGQLYWWATINYSVLKKLDIAYEDDSKVDRWDVLRAFQHYDATVVKIMESTPATDILQIQTRDRTPIKSFVDQRIALIGDAAHPMLTSMGQGACVAIEDAVALTESIIQARQSVGSEGESSCLPEAFQTYNKRRVKRANFFVKTSRQVAWHEQLEQTWACYLRDAIFSHLPKSVIKKQLMGMFKEENV